MMESWMKAGTARVLTRPRSKWQERSSLVARFLAASLLLVVGVGGCKGPMAKIAAERDALVADDDAQIKDATSGFATCPDLPPVIVKPTDAKGPYDDGCLGEIANGLGSKKGFSAKPPDHAAAATVALVLLRDGRGDHVAHADWWFNAMKSSQGVGVDVLRLAVARKMLAEAAPLVGRTFTIEEEVAPAKTALKAIAGAIPGACPTYWLVGTDAKAIPPEQEADHSACVFQDLARRDGPGGTYGDGHLPRAPGCRRSLARSGARPAPRFGIR